MQNSLLVQTLLAFSPDERLEIQRFLADSYFNRGNHAKQRLRLFTLLDDKIARKQLDGLTKDLLFTEFFGHEKASKGYFDNLMSELLALIRQFIWLQEANDEIAHDLATARFYRSRGLENKALQLLNQMPKRSERSPKMTPDQLLWRFEQELERSEIESGHNHRQGDLNLSATLEALTVFYSNHLLQLAAALYQQEGFVPQLNTGWAAFIEPFRENLRERGHFGHPVLEIFEQALRLVTRTSHAPEQDLAHFVASIREHESLLSEWSLKNLAAYARNFCSYHLQRGKPHLHVVLLSLYQEHLNKGWLYENGLLQPSSLMNMVTMGLRNGQNEWVLQLLASHRNQIAHNGQETVWSYCMAVYHFHLGSLEQANHFIVRQKQKDIEIEKSMRILSIKIAYEQSPQSVYLEDLVRAFLEFLKRNKNRLLEKKMEMNFNFARTVKQMSALQRSGALLPPKPSQEDLLLQVTNPLYEVAERNWLLKKIVLL